MHNHTHEEAQREELEFWQTPGAELGEQLKQLAYMKYLGLSFEHDGNSPYVINKSGLSIMDIGGGPVSLLLKTVARRKTVVDPCDFPKWVGDRYKANQVDFLHHEAEVLLADVYNGMADEVWMYNVLQHTSDPQKIFRNIHRFLRKGGTFRLLDWVNTPTNVAHPITLKPEQISGYLIDAGFNGTVTVHNINENDAVGTIAYAVHTK